MRESVKRSLILTLLQNLTEQWSWLKTIYLIEGSPFAPEKYRSLRQLILPAPELQEVKLQFDAAEYNYNWISEQTVGCWLEPPQQIRPDYFTMVIRLILVPPDRIRQFRAAKLNISLQNSKYTVLNLSDLEVNPKRFLVPPGAKLLGCWPSEHRQFTPVNREPLRVTTDEILTIQTWKELDGPRPPKSKYIVRLFRFKVEKERLTTTAVRTVDADPWTREIAFSRDGTYIGWEESRNGIRQRVLMRTNQNQPFLRYDLPTYEKDGFDLLGWAWINDTEWIEYHEDKDSEKDGTWIDRYSIRTKAEKVSHWIPDLMTSIGELNGVNDRGELVFGGWQKNGRTRRTIISLTDYKRREETVQAKIDSGEGGSALLSPDGKWLAWYVEKQADSREVSLDGWFFYQELWITRSDGSTARHVADLAWPQPGHLHAGPGSIFWTADSLGLYTQIGDCFYLLS